MFLWTKTKKVDNDITKMINETNYKVEEARIRDEEQSNDNMDYFTKILNKYKEEEEKERKKIEECKKIEDWKKYCKMYNEKLYRIFYPWGNSFSFGKPYFQEKTNVVEFIDMENMKEIIIKLSETDTITVIEV